MATTSPARIDDDLFASAKLAGEAQSRSASQQVAHWARIGREIEASASINLRAIGQVLAGRRSYDRLDSEEQAVVRAQWTERMRLLSEGLDLPGRFKEEARRWVELDADGNVVDREAASLSPTRRTAGRGTAAGTAAGKRVTTGGTRAKAAGAAKTPGRVRSNKAGRARKT